MPIAVFVEGKQRCWGVSTSGQARDYVLSYSCREAIYAQSSSLPAACIFTCQNTLACANRDSPIKPSNQTIDIMSENKPPNESQAAAASAADQPGRPYYESLRTTLRGTLDKKRKLDEQLAALEDQIFKLEGAYLEETSNSGNIVRGFDGWVKGVSVGGRAADDRRRGRVRDEDRVFSRSSVGWMKVCCSMLL